MQEEIQGQKASRINEHYVSTSATIPAPDVPIVNTESTTPYQLSQKESLQINNHNLFFSYHHGDHNAAAPGSFR